MVLIISFVIINILLLPYFVLIPFNFLFSFYSSCGQSLNASKLFPKQECHSSGRKAFKMKKTMDVMVEMLGNEPAPTQILPPLTSVGPNSKLALVSINLTEAIPLTIGDAPTPKDNVGVPIVRVVVGSDHSSQAKEVTKSLKRKNSPLAQESSTIPIGTTSKKRRLVKKSELVSFQKGNTSSLSHKISSSNKVSKCKESSSRGTDGDLSTALIPNESRLHFQLSPDSTPMIIAELLNNHALGMSLNGEHNLPYNPIH